MITFFNIIFPIIIFPYASRILLPENYGKYDFAISFISYFAVCANLGVQSYAIKELVLAKIKGDEELKRSFSEIIIITLVSSIIVSIVYCLVIFSVEITKHEIELFLIGGIQVYSAFLTIDYFFIAQERHRRRVIRVAIIKVLSLVFMFKLVKVPEDYLRFMSIIVIPQLILKIIDFYTIRKYLKFKNINLKRHLKTILILFIYMFSTIVYTNFDITIIGFVLGSEKVGIYGMGMKITRIVIPIITALGIVLAPKIINEITKKNLKEVQKISNLYFDFLFFTSLPVIFILYYFSTEVIFFIGGDQYKDSSSILRILLPLIVLSSLNDFISVRLLIPNFKEKIVTISGMIGILLNIIFNFIFIDKFKLIGVAYIMVISEAIILFIRYFFLRKIYPTYKIFSINILKYFILILIMYIINYLMDSYIIMKKIFFMKRIIIVCVMYLIGIVILKDRFYKEIKEKIYLKLNNK